MADVWLRSVPSDADSDDVRLYPEGADAGGPVNYVLTCDVGAYVYTGQAATLTVARRLALDAGAYNYVGNAAILDYVPGAAGPVNYTLALAAGTYLYVGQDAILTYVDNSTPVVPMPYWDVQVGLAPIKKHKVPDYKLLLLG